MSRRYIKNSYSLSISCRKCKVYCISETTNKDWHYKKNSENSIIHDSTRSHRASEVVGESLPQRSQRISCTSLAFRFSWGAGEEVLVLLTAHSKLKLTMLSGKPPGRPPCSASRPATKSQVQQRVQGVTTRYNRQLAWRSRRKDNLNDNW